MSCWGRGACREGGSRWGANVPPAGPVILVVEDEAAIREMLQALLEQEGYTVETAADGASGLARIEAGGLDLVILDLMLPELDGLELCRRVRARAGKSYLPILMLTALDTEPQLITGFDAGADDYVGKPFPAEVLLARVRRLLRRRSSGER